MSIAIKAENISKAYQLGQIGTGTVSRDIERWFAKLRGKEDPFLKIGETNDRTQKGSSDIVWSLKDINFEINQGDAVGIIGRNGAGKSTLLKLLSRVTSPTTGNFKVKGRIASLLEVGTGFHPELTGKENIYLNGAILGMRKQEIKRKFDEIVAFSGVERYIDTPVKRYSSGMYVRLAFAVAAHLESEILIVDEVLAVGDADFQKKCLGKMGEVSKGEGRTVLFVSHNMSAVSALCNKGILMQNGTINFIGSSIETINTYNQSDSSDSIYVEKNLEIKKPYITKAEIDRTELEKGNLKINVFFKSEVELDVPIVGVVVYDILGMPLFGTNALVHGKNFNGKILKKGISELTINDLPLHTGSYRISLWLGDKTMNYDVKKDILSFEFVSNKLTSTNLPDISVIGSMNIIGKWRVYEID